MKSALVIPIIRNSDNPAYLSNFRPISLINCIAKILEKLANKRLMWVLEEENLTNTNLIALETEIMLAFEKDDQVGAIF